jgi:hypothetical protein
MRDIGRHRPWEDCHQRVLDAVNKTKEDPLLLEEVYRVLGLETTLLHLRLFRGLEREIRLYGASCARHVMKYVKDNDVLSEAITAAENFSNGLISKKKLDAYFAKAARQRTTKNYFSVDMALHVCSHQAKMRGVLLVENPRLVIEEAIQDAHKNNICAMQSEMCAIESYIDRYDKSSDLDEEDHCIEQAMKAAEAYIVAAKKVLYALPDRDIEKAVKAEKDWQNEEFLQMCRLEGKYDRGENII